MEPLVPVQHKLEDSYGLAAGTWIRMIRDHAESRQRLKTCPCAGLLLTADVKPRYDQLREAFSKTFGGEPELYGRAPGRP
jgi:hypothetical protein